MLACPVYIYTGYDISIMRMPVAMTNISIDQVAKNLSHASRMCTASDHTETRGFGVPENGYWSNMHPILWV